MYLYKLHFIPEVLHFGVCAAVAAPLSIASSIDAAGQLLASPIAPLMTVPVSTPNYSIYPYGTFHSVPPFGCPPGDPYCTSYGYY